MKDFYPRMDVLPMAQQALWQSFAPAATLGYTLYGGTAIALQLGHRDSIDFDFFTDKPLNREQLYEAFGFLPKALVYFKGGDIDTLTVQEKQTLVDAASAVRTLPHVVLAGKNLAVPR